MPQKDSARNPALRKFGAELARLRRMADLSQEALGRPLNLRGATIGHYERALRTPSRTIVSRLDEALGAEGKLLALWPEFSRAAYPEYAGDFFQAVPTATVMRDYHPTLIPGPLQTEEYAWATIKAGSHLATDDEISRLVNSRMQRREELSASRNPAIWAIITEITVKHLATDPGILAGQVELLLELSESRVRLQVLPWSVGIRYHPGLSGPFTVLSFADKADIVYVEGVGTGNLISDPQKVEEIRFRFGTLQAAALSPEQTSTFLQNILEGDPRELAQI
ncbi:helix-turn-helix domain-containing protein [Marinactinospora thermotolerans]|nr:helix-turn-helix transcriptional regulator [Marinactinospora thermotolerans]